MNFSPFALRCTPSSSTYKLTRFGRSQNNPIFLFKIVKDKPSPEDQHQTSQQMKIAQQNLSSLTTQEDNKT